MTEFAIDNEPLAVCSTNALKEALVSADHHYTMRDAIRAELETRSDWPAIMPYGGLCETPAR